MPISKEEVRHIAHLARLELTSGEIEHFQGQLEGILAYIDKLRSLNVERIEPTVHALDIKNVLRPDIRRPSLEIDKALRIAPQREGDFYKVPRVIE